MFTILTAPEDELESTEEDLQTQTLFQFDIPRQIAAGNRGGCAEAYMGLFSISNRSGLARHTALIQNWQKRQLSSVQNLQNS